jgi:hypothetical protein
MVELGVSGPVNGRNINKIVKAFNLAELVI